MSTLYIGPTKANDVRAHFAFMERTRKEDSSIFIPLGGVIERECFKGPWPKASAFFEQHLPALRAELGSIIGSVEPEAVHIDVGADLGTLYTAYYLTLRRPHAPITVTLHTPNDGQMYVGMQPDGTKVEVPGKLQFGGTHVWTQHHPLLVRRIALLALSAVEEVWVTNQEDGARLFATLPSLDREIKGTPVFIGADSPVPA